MWQNRQPYKDSEPCHTGEDFRVQRFLACHDILSKLPEGIFNVFYNSIDVIIFLIPSFLLPLPYPFPCLSSASSSSFSLLIQIFQSFFYFNSLQNISFDVIDPTNFKYFSLLCFLLLFLLVLSINFLWVFFLRFSSIMRQMFNELIFNMSCVLKFNLWLYNPFDYC